MLHYQRFSRRTERERAGKQQRGEEKEKKECLRLAQSRSYSAKEKIQLPTL